MDVIKSSRFWLALLAMVGAFVLSALGKITGGEAIATIIGILGGFGVAKASGSSTTPMVILIGASMFTLSSCASVPEKLDAVREANRAMTDIALDAFHIKCTEEAKKCGNAECEAYKKCDAAREKAMKISRAVNVAIVVGSTASTIGEKERADEQVGLAIDLLSKLKQIYEEYFK